MKNERNNSKEIIWVVYHDLECEKHTTISLVIVFRYIFFQIGNAQVPKNMLHSFPIHPVYILLRGGRRFKHATTCIEIHMSCKYILKGCVVETNMADNRGLHKV